MILSRNVEVEVKAKLTSKNDRYSSFAAHDGDLGRWPRVVGVASQVLGGHHVVSAAVSLKDETDRVNQAKEIVRVFRQSRFPTILAGDLNSEPNSNPMNIIEAVFKATYDKSNPEYTFPSDDPIKKIDYILYYPENRWKVKSKKVICDLVASDHCVYVVELELVGL